LPRPFLFTAAEHRRPLVNEALEIFEDALSEAEKELKIT